MNIEFRCPGCDKLLSVPESAAGREVRCPECNTVARILGSPAAEVPRDNPQPNSDQAPNSDPPPAAESTGNASAASNDRAGRINPYQTPASIGGIPPVTVGGAGVPTAVNAGQVLGYAFETWKTNILLVVGISILAMGVQILFNFATRIVNDVWANLALTLVEALVNVFLQIGMMQVHLKLSRGQAALFTDVFGGGSRLLPALLVIVGLYFAGAVIAGIGLLVGGPFGLAGAIGFVILAGMILGLVYWPVAFYLVDGNSIVDSFAAAPAVAMPNVLTTILLGIAGIAIVLIGFLSLCVGIVAAVPLVGLVWSTAYLMIKGEIPTTLKSPRQLQNR